jgi:hypothetical protein
VRNRNRTHVAIPTNQPQTAAPTTTQISEIELDPTIQSSLTTRALAVLRRIATMATEMKSVAPP